MEMGTTTLDMVIGGMRGITVGLRCRLIHANRLSTLWRTLRRFYACSAQQDAVPRQDGSPRC